MSKKRGRKVRQRDAMWRFEILSAKNRGTTQSSHDPVDALRRYRRAKNCEVMRIIHLPSRLAMLVESENHFNYMYRTLISHVGTYRKNRKGRRS